MAGGIALGCEGPNPCGVYNGPGVTRMYEPMQTPAEESLGNTITVAKKSGDVFHVTFGPCWVDVKRPKQTVDSTWKVVDGSSCPSAMGEVKLGAGSLLVLSEKSVSLSAIGMTTDGKTQVTFVFVGDKR